MEEVRHIIWVTYGNQEHYLALIYIKMTKKYAPQIQISLGLFKLPRIIQHIFTVRDRKIQVKKHNYKMEI